jgi:hypothetical protein
MEEWGRGGLTDVGQDSGDVLQVGEERDKGEGFLAGGADEGEDLIDPGQEGGPSGWSGGRGIRCSRLCPLRLGSRGGGFCRERRKWTGRLTGQDVVLLGPGGDQRPKGGVGGEDPMVAVPMDAGWREDRGEAIQELESREA